MLGPESRPICPSSSSWGWPVVALGGCLSSAMCEAILAGDSSHRGGMDTHAA